MKYYIADYHFGHSKLNFALDKRGFDSVEKMDEYMVEQWNKTVRSGDEVYILGDLFWRNDPQWIVQTLYKMRGSKYLIRGNHDVRWLKDYDNDKHHCFRWIKDYAEVKDNKRTVILSHYPIMSYKHQFDANVWMLHGHIHFTEDVELVEGYKELCRQHTRKDERTGGIESPCSNLINCFCMASDYKPLTLDQWITKEKNGELKQIRVFD